MTATRRMRPPGRELVTESSYRIPPGARGGPGPRCTQIFWGFGGPPVSMVRMLSEEALILVGVLVACGLLLLGVMELLWPARRRPVLRRPDLARRRAVGLGSNA